MEFLIFNQGILCSENEVTTILPLFSHLKIYRSGILLDKLMFFLLSLIKVIRTFVMLSEHTGLKLLTGPAAAQGAGQASSDQMTLDNGPLLGTFRRQASPLNSQYRNTTGSATVWCMVIKVADYVYLEQRMPRSENHYLNNYFIAKGTHSD